MDATSPLSGEENVKLFQDIEGYLNNAQHTQYIQREILNFLSIKRDREKQFSALTFRILLDFMEVQDSWHTLSKWLVLEPVITRTAIEDTIHMSVVNMSNRIQRGYSKYDPKIQRGQVHLQLRVRGFPYIIEELRVKAWQSTGLSIVRGVLVSREKKVKYIKQYAWYCPEQCDDSTTVLPRIPPTALRCSSCNLVMLEMPGARDCGDMALGTFINKEVFLQSQDFSFMAVTRQIWLLDEMIDMSILGHEYILPVVVESKALKAWHIEEIKPPISNIYLHSSLRRFIQQYERATPELCSWSFVFEMAKCLPFSVDLPRGTLPHLCLGLILSIASIQVEEVGGIPVCILALGSNSISTNRLMNAAAKYAQRVVYGSTLASGFSVDTKRGNTDVEEAGPLTLARGGICLLGNWTLYASSSRDAFAIKSAIESGKCAEQPLKCSIWTHWEFSKTAKDRSQLAILTNLFGMTFVADDGERQLNTLVNHILEKAVSPQYTEVNSQNSANAIMEEGIFNKYHHSKNVDRYDGYTTDSSNFSGRICYEYDDTEDDVDSLGNGSHEEYGENKIMEERKKFVELFEFTANLNVILDPDAECLLTNYFICIRKDSSACVPVKTLSVLGSLSKAHARLNLRSIATADDVLLAIYLHHHSLCSQYGESGISFPVNKGEIQLDKACQHMIEFGNCLKHYIQTIIGEIRVSQQLQ